VLAGGDESAVAFKLERMQRPRIVESGPTGSPTWMWIGWGSTVAFTAGAAVTGIVAYSQSKELKRLNEVAGVDVAQRDSAYSSAKGLGIASTILTGGAIVCAGVSTYLSIKRYSNRKPLEVVASPMGAFVRGEF